MPRDIEDNFEDLLRDRQHTELIQVLNKLVDVNSNKKEPNFSKVLEDISIKLLNFAKEIRDSNNSKEVAELFKKVTNTLFEIKVEISKQNSVKKWVFDIKRNASGQIESVEAIKK